MRCIFQRKLIEQQTRLPQLHKVPLKARFGEGILRNPLYSGSQVWNRVRMLKDPATGRRVSRVNPEADWQIVECSHLRIIDQALFERVAARTAATGGSHAQHAPKSKRLLSGLLKCGGCGGGMSIIGSDRSGPRIQCNVFKESGACNNSARYYVQKIEAIVVAALRQQLSEPDLIREYVKTYREERNRAERDARRKRSTLDKDYAKCKSEIQRLVGSIAKGLITEDEAATLLATTRLELARIETQLTTADCRTNVIELHPQAVQRFKENLDSLAEVLKQDATPDLELTGAFRSLVDSVVVHPRKAGEEHEVSIQGYLASLMGAEMSAELMVARDRYRFSPHDANLRYFLRSSA